MSHLYRPRLFSCGHFGTSHNIHHIRALRALKDELWLPVDSIYVDDFYIYLEVDGDVLRRWNHHMNRSDYLIDGTSPIEFCPNHHLLGFGYKGSRATFGVDTTMDYDGCVAG